MTLKDSAQRLAVLKALKDAVSAEEQRARDDTLTDLLDAHEEAGVKSVDVCLPDGTKIATISLGGGEEKPSIADGTVFLEWVKANHPTEVETVQRVRGAYVGQILKSGVDTATGEVIPGIELKPSSKHPRVYFAKDGRDAVARAWQRGELEKIAYPEVES